MRRSFLPFLAVAWCTGAVLRALPQPPRTHPNVVLLVSDDQGFGDVSSHGNPNLATPHLDALADSGARFGAFHVQPVCSPTRAELLTGRWHPRGGVHGVSRGGERLDLDETTIAECFAAAGYRTAAFGKWHNGTQGSYHPRARGFETFHGFTSGHWGCAVDPLLDHDSQVVSGKGFLPDHLTDRAIHWMETHRAEPFFLLLAYDTPHSPMQVLDADWETVRERPLVRRGTRADLERPDHTRAALALCENLDRNVGRLQAALERLGLRGDTIVVYLSDNGPNGHRWNAGLRGTKGSTDEGGTRSPLFVSWPGVIPRGRRVDALAGAIDLLPTLLALAGVPRRGEKPLDGISLAEHLRTEPATSWPVRELHAHWGGRVAVRTGRFRLDHRGRLYDLIADPGQTTDVADVFPAVARHLAASVDRWRRDVLAEDPRAERPFPIGHDAVPATWLPVRDATFTGCLDRSSRHPNDSFLTHWCDPRAVVRWNVEVLRAGTYRATAYVTCRSADVGCLLELTAGSARTRAVVDRAFDPPTRGEELDRVPRDESPVKDWMAFDLGALPLERGAFPLELRAPVLVGECAVDLRLVVLTEER